MDNKEQFTELSTKIIGKKRKREDETPKTPLRKKRKLIEPKTPEGQRIIKGECPSAPRKTLEQLNPNIFNDLQWQNLLANTRRDMEREWQKSDLPPSTI